jgi:hypothetical protein
MRKVRVEATFDRAAYAPGDWVRVIALVHGESTDRVHRGRAHLINRIELTTRGIDQMRDEPEETRIHAMHRFHDNVPMQQIAPLSDGTPRLWCDIPLPDDARPTERNELYSVTWQVRVDAKRKGFDIGERAPLTVVPRGQEPPPDPSFHAG